MHDTQDVIWLNQMMFQKRVKENNARLYLEVEIAIVGCQAGKSLKKQRPQNKLKNNRVKRVRRPDQRIGT